MGIGQPSFLVRHPRTGDKYFSSKINLHSLSTEASKMAKISDFYKIRPKQVFFSMHYAVFCHSGIWLTNHAELLDLASNQACSQTGICNSTLPSLPLFWEEGPNIELLLLQVAWEERGNMTGNGEGYWKPQACRRAERGMQTAECPSL